MDNVETLYPLTPMQHGMLLRALQSAGAGEYVEQVGWTIRGAYDPGAFERAWGLVLERHPALRTAFFWEGMDEPVQVVRRDAHMAVERHDRRGVPPAEAAERVATLVAAERGRGFDLGAAPLLRVAEVRLEDGTVRVLVSYHHLVMDGWSLAVCLRDVLAAYDALRRGESPAWEPAPPFARYVARVRGRDAAESEAFWRGELAGLDEPTRLAPVTPAAVDGGSGGHATVSLVLDAALIGRLAALARKGQVTLNTVFAGAWGLLLARLAGTDDAVFGTVVSDRPADLPGAGGIVGLCIGEVPVRVRLDPAAAPVAWLRDLQAAQSRARPHAHLAPSQVQPLSAVPAGERLYDTVLVFQNLPDAGPAAAAGGEMGDLRREPMAGAGGHAAVLMVVPGATVTLDLTHDAGRLDGEAAARLLAHLRTLLKGIAEDDGSNVGALSPLSADERRQVVHGWNDTARDFPSDLRFHQLVEAQAARTPGRVAVEGGGEALTYADLEARTDRLAARLREHGVGPDSRVAVLVDRSPAMVVALLAVLKAGGAYVPLDPAHPAERLSLILRDSAARVLLTREPLAALVPTDGVVVVDVDGQAPAPSGPLSPASGRKGEHDEPEDAGALSHSRTFALSHSSSLSYVIYTSGSTGTPKGVAIPHRALVNFLVS
ncbi:MAG TPA: condensation domain-containing protein, partial [Longimicrobiaceae bacterium]|nr:condensation domain-containing protein [Longimicrobiaceae bacterium]